MPVASRLPARQVWSASGAAIARLSILGNFTLPLDDLRTLDPSKCAISKSRLGNVMSVDAYLLSDVSRETGE